MALLFMISWPRYLATCVEFSGFKLKSLAPLTLSLPSRALINGPCPFDDPSPAKSDERFVKIKPRTREIMRRRQEDLCHTSEHG